MKMPNQSTHNQEQFIPPPPAPDRAPLHEATKRFGEGGAGLFIAAKAVGLEDHRRMLAMHAKRLCEDHRAMQIAGGHRPAEDGIDCPEMKEGEDPMGDITVTGDNYYYNVPDHSKTHIIPDESPTEETRPPAEEPSILEKLFKAAPWVLAWALSLSALAYFLLPQEENGQSPDTNTDTITTVTVE